MSMPIYWFMTLIGTPVNKADKNTFWAFGSEEDEGGYMSRYTFHDSIRDNATLPLHFEPRLVDVHVDKETIDKAESKSSFFITILINKSNIRNVSLTLRELEIAELKEEDMPMV